jgi:putative nucleotidyltransferase with HDIG domain
MDEFEVSLNQPILNRIISLIPDYDAAYLVGGAIRDALLRRHYYDLDFVLPGNAIKLARRIGDAIGAAYFPLDTHRNMARLVLIPDESVDGLRINPRRIDFSTFQGVDLISDLQGRDFTMNAMAVEVHQLGELIDPLGGATDLAANRLKACSQQSIINDPVRILRAVRFSVELELRIEPKTLEFIKQGVVLLPEVSSERLRDELFRILLLPNSSSAIRILDKFHALEHVLPEITKLKNIQQSPPHIMNAWEHTLETLVQIDFLLNILAEEYNPDLAGNLTMGLVGLRLGRYRQQLIDYYKKSINPDRPQRGLLYLAGLYHDVGKLKAQKVEEDGRIRFIEHEQIGSKLVEKRGKALKLSNQEIERLMTIVKHHMRLGLLSRSNELPSKKAIYRFFRDTGEAGIDICILSMADILATYGPTLPQERWVRHLDVIREMMDAWWEDRTESIFPPPLVNGDDLLKELDIIPGPMVGYLLEVIYEAQIAGEIHSRQEAIGYAKKMLKQRKIKSG